MSVKPVAWTPGPWTANTKSVVPRIFGPDMGFRGGDCIASLQDNAKGNAALICAAPELVEALEELVEQAAQQNEAQGSPNNSLTPVIAKAVSLLARITPK